MDDQPVTLRSCLDQAEQNSAKFETAEVSTGTEAQSFLHAAIAKYEQCMKIARDVSLFSPNEELQDVASADLKYFLIPYRLAQLKFRLAEGDREDNIQSARQALDQFLSRLDSYHILDQHQQKTFERYHDDPAKFSVIATNDATRRRDLKIADYKADKSLKEKLTHLRRHPDALRDDDTTLRELRMTEISLNVNQAFQSLESINQELNVLALKPRPFFTGDRSPQEDKRLPAQDSNGYSERLDPSLSQLNALGRNGPILNPDGRPLRPFTLLDTRQSMQQGVFRPDHNLPSMTIDEYLEEERKRGGMIDGGGPQSQQKPPIDEDDMNKADKATMKARDWDEFVENNPKGSGNTMNMG